MAAELTDLRLPANLNNCIRIQSKCFEKERYLVEETVHYKDEKGIRQEKACPVTNFIRWRYEKGKESIDSQKLSEFGVTQDAKTKMVSNARLVEWSDGTKTLVIGNQQYEVQIEAMNSTMCFAQYKKFSLHKGNVS